ncbi:MAG: hypothetical protein WC307_06540 [Candidatus Nanoarchaeia archaeon]|jgi:hypothetical protein
MSFDEDCCSAPSTLSIILSQLEPIKRTGTPVKVYEATKWFDKYFLKKHQIEYLQALTFQYYTYGDMDALINSIQIANAMGLPDDDFIGSMKFKPNTLKLRHAPMYESEVNVITELLGDAKPSLETLLNNLAETKRVIDTLSECIDLSYKFHNFPEDYVAWKGCVTVKKEDETTGELIDDVLEGYYIDTKPKTDKLPTDDIKGVYI